MAEFLHRPRAWRTHTGAKLYHIVPDRNLYVRPAAMQFASSGESTSQCGMTAANEGEDTGGAGHGHSFPLGWKVGNGEQTDAVRPLAICKQATRQ